MFDQADGHMIWSVCYYKGGDSVTRVSCGELGLGRWVAKPPPTLLQGKARCQRVKPCMNGVEYL